MAGELQHHGILGMKWGVRRTPAQLGHEPNGQGGGAGGKGAADSGRKRTPERSANRVRGMSDDEIRQRISRLKMEEEYTNLVARQKARNTSGVKKALGDAFGKFGRGLLDIAVTKALNKMFDKDGKFDIDEWKNADVNDMDADTIQKVSKWYANAKSITTARQGLSPTKPSSPASEAEKPSSSYTSDSSPSKPRDSSSSTSTKLPWMYRAAGRANRRASERIERERRRSDKSNMKWLI